MSKLLVVEEKLTGQVCLYCGGQLPKQLILDTPATAAGLCRQQHRWADERAERSQPGFLTKLFKLKRPPNTGYADATAGGYLEMLATFLSRVEDRPHNCDTNPRPKPSAANITALALYPDVQQVLDILEMEYDTLTEHHWRSGEDTIKWREDETRINCVLASLREFFADKLPTAESIELVAEYIKTYHKDKFPTPAPGDLWLATPHSKKPVRALPRCLFNYAHYPNKIVLGGAGSGRSVMMGRLSRAAHEGGDMVVMIAMRQRKRAMYHFTKKAGGATRRIDTKSQACFNPFWFPDAAYMSPGATYEPHITYLADLLVCLLQTATGRIEEPRARLSSFMPSLLLQYYQAQPWEASTGPSFNSFYEFATNEARKQWPEGKDPHQEFRTWLTETGKQWPQDQYPHQAFLEWLGKAGKQWTESQYPMQYFLAWLTEAGNRFYADGDLAYLMAATPKQAEAMFTTKNRLLYFEMFLGHAGEEIKDAVATSCVSWLLLFGCDVHLSLRTNSNTKPLLTVALDELLDECLDEFGAVFMESYMKFGRYHARTTNFSWHNHLDCVFHPNHKVAHVIRNNAGCLLLVGPPSWFTRPGLEKILWLGEADTARVKKMQGFEVVITGPARFSGRYDAGLSPEELASFRALEK